jgi:hypothetical protein
MVILIVLCVLPTIVSAPTIIHNVGINAMREVIAYKANVTAMLDLKEVNANRKNDKIVEY